MVKIKQGYGRLNKAERSLIPFSDLNFLGYYLGDYEILKNEETWVKVNMRWVTVNKPFKDCSFDKSVTWFDILCNEKIYMYYMMHRVFADYTY